MIPIKALRSWRRLGLSALVVALLFAVVVVVGRVPARAYRESGHRSLGTRTNPAVEMTADYTIGFVEFDDQGWLWDREQVNAVTNQLQAEQSTNGLLLVVFVHGWMHDASPEDDNVRTFRKKVLRPLATMENFLSKRENRPARRVAGVYVGWRGLSQDVPIVKFATFWGRKDAAERVGHGAVVELFSELEKLKVMGNARFRSQVESHQRMATKLLIIGHSFGGDVVYSAVAPILIERMVESVDGDGNPSRPKTMGDMVVLINPAFEAARFETLHRLAANGHFPPGQNCLLAVFTSKADWATKAAFPAGRFVHSLMESERDAEQRSANRTAVGHYAPYIDFDLVVGSKEEPDDEGSRSGEQAMILKQELKRASTNSGSTVDDRTFKFTHCQLVPRSNAATNSPVLVAAVDPNIIPDHGSIDRGVFTRFLVEFLYSFSETQN